MESERGREELCRQEGGVARDNFVLRSLLNEGMEPDRLCFFDPLRGPLRNPRGLEYDQRKWNNAEGGKCMRCQGANAEQVRLNPCNCAPFCNGCLTWAENLAVAEGRQAWRCVICDGETPVRAAGNEQAAGHEQAAENEQAGGNEKAAGNEQEEN